MRRVLAALRHRVHTAKCPSGCYCVKDGWVWRCSVCNHIC